MMIAAHAHGPLPWACAFEAATCRYLSAMQLVRRFVLLCLLMFWIGGFTFYAAVVVPIGTEVLGSPLDQGWITRRVTFWLNVAGVFALAAWAWDLAAEAAPTRLLGATRWLLWLFIAAMLVALFILHPQMDTLLNVERERVLDRALFRTLHRVYLWVSTVQWGAALVLILATVHTWNRRPHNIGEPEA
jgi:hypothetical protein